ncbi:hypothetical protein I315_02427 [Cryptococcus gattii Ru294]|nr:hypothetical protein I315_02427 [Cryptococcus gattii Ru294]
MRFVVLSEGDNSSRSPRHHDGSSVVESMITSLKNQLGLNNKLVERFLTADEARQIEYEKQLIEYRDKLDKLENARLLMESSYEQESFALKGRVFELENQIMKLKAREHGREQQKDGTVCQFEQQEEIFEDQLRAQRKDFETRQIEAMARMEKLESALTMMKKSKSKKSVNFCEMATVRTFDQPQSALLNRGKQINGMDCSSASATPVRSSVPVAVVLPLLLQELLCLPKQRQQMLTMLRTYQSV